MSSVQLELARTLECTCAWHDEEQSESRAIRTIPKIRPRRFVFFFLATNFSRATKNQESRRRQGRSRFEDQPSHERPCSRLFPGAAQTQESGASLPRSNCRSRRRKRFPDPRRATLKCAQSFRLGRWFESQSPRPARGARDWLRAPAS